MFVYGFDKAVYIGLGQLGRGPEPLALVFHGLVYQRGEDQNREVFQKRIIPYKFEEAVPVHPGHLNIRHKQRAALFQGLARIFQGQ